MVELIESLETFKVEKDLKPRVHFFETLLIKRYENVLKELDV